MKEEGRTAPPPRNNRPRPPRQDRRPEPDTVLLGRRVKVMFMDGKTATATLLNIGRYWVYMTIEDGDNTRKLIVNKAWIASYELIE